MHNSSINSTDFAILNTSIPATTCYSPTTIETVPVKVQYYLIVLYGLTSLVSIVGNVTVILVQVLGREAARNMRKYLINLAVSDLISGVLLMPFSLSDFILRKWIFYAWLCPTTQFLQLLSGMY